MDLADRVPLAVAWTSAGILLGDLYDDQAVEIMVPDFDPCRLEVTWRVNGVSSEPIEVELLLGQQRQLSRNGAASVEIVTEVGDVYALSRRLEPVPRPGPSTPSPASRRERSGVPDTRHAAGSRTEARRQSPEKPRAYAEIESGFRSAGAEDAVGRAQEVARSSVDIARPYPTVSKPRPIVLGVVGDAASGKTTLVAVLVDILGPDIVLQINLRDYLKYSGDSFIERDLTPLHPEGSYMDIITQELHALRNGKAILKPEYRQSEVPPPPLRYVEPEHFVIVEGLLGYYTPEMRDAYDVRVYLDPSESLRREWKVNRDCSQRGYMPDQVLDDLDRHEPDSAAFIRPQRAHADMVVRLQSSADDPFVLDAVLTLRNSLPHPDLSPFVDESDGVFTLTEGPDDERVLNIPGTLERERAAEIEEAIWDRMHFASHLRSYTLHRLGEFTVGTVVHHSEPLALMQLLILYHLTMARAIVVLGGEPSNGS